MKTIRPSDQQAEAFMDGEHDGKPVVMLNMLKFRDIAEYPEGSGEPADRTGREAYEIYSKSTTPHLLSVGGKLLWMGEAGSTLIGPEGETWDRVFLVYFPSRDARKKMLANPDFQAGSHHRTAALEDSRLIETSEIKLPRLALMAMGLVYRLKALFH